MQPYLSLLLRGEPSAARNDRLAMCWNASTFQFVEFHKNLSQSHMTRQEIQGWCQCYHQGTRCHLPWEKYKPCMCVHVIWNILISIERLNFSKYDFHENLFDFGSRAGKILCNLPIPDFVKNWKISKTKNKIHELISLTFISIL